VGEERQPRRRRISAEERRERIIEAAIIAFADKSLQAVSLDDVAESAGISKALIYEHFDSKAALYDATLRASHAKLVTIILEALVEADGPEARMRIGTDAFLRFVEEHREAWRLVFRNVGDPEIAPTLQNVQDEARALVADLLETYAPEKSPVEGLEMDVAIEVFAQQIVGAGQAIANWWDDNREVPREVVLQAHMDFAWIGLQRIAAGERWTPDAVPSRLPRNS
jgi:AcrR family transcriptional regulator